MIHTKHEKAQLEWQPYTLTSVDAEGCYIHYYIDFYQDMGVYDIWCGAQETHPEKYKIGLYRLGYRESLEEAKQKVEEHHREHCVKMREELARWP